MTEMTDTPPCECGFAAGLSGRCICNEPVLARRPIEVVRRISDAAKKLNEDLHEPVSNEERWEIIQNALDEAFSDGYLSKNRTIFRNGVKFEKD